MELNAFEIIQNGKKMYLAFITAKDLITRVNTKVDIYSSENKDGYQREPTKSRVKQVAQFLLSEKGVFPLSVLLSVRGNLTFRSKESNYGKIKFEDSETLWQVDGQHRIAGLIEAVNLRPELENFEMPVIIIQPNLWVKGVQNPQFLEAYQFYVINKTQKGVRSDLAEQFLARLIKEEKNIENILKLPSILTKGIDWVPDAIEIAKELNNKSEVWKDKIRFPNEPKAQTTISQKSFTDSLKPILNHDSFKQYEIHELVEFLNRYWSAIRELIPEVFEFPKEYAMQKITGPFVLHKLFPDVASYCEGKLTVENLKEVIGGFKEGITKEFWSNNGTVGITGTNRKAFSILEKRLRELLAKSNAKSKPHRPFEL